MKVAIIICSANRNAFLEETAASLLRQTHPPVQFLCCIPAQSKTVPHLPEGVELILGRTGLTLQRNDALAKLSADVDLVLFLDDDIELAEDYIERMAEAFAGDPDIAIASGRVLADGVRLKREIPRAMARQILDRRTSEHGLRSLESAYGCNMAIRSDLARRCKFDERLPLYGYLEDRDFTYECAKAGKAVEVSSACAVHLASISGGRANGIHYGYSQIVNPLYLIRKWHLPLMSIVYKNWVKGIAANLLGLFRKDGIDRVGRLKGNAIAFADIIARRDSPERVSKFW